MHNMLVPHAFSKVPDQWYFAPILDTGEFVFFSGITGVHPNQSLSDDPETQFRDTFKFVATHLETAGLHFGHTVEMTTYHARLRKHLNAFIKKKRMCENTVPRLDRDRRYRIDYRGDAAGNPNYGQTHMTRASSRWECHTLTGLLRMCLKVYG